MLEGSTVGWKKSSSKTSLLLCFPCDRAEGEQKNNYLRGLRSPTEWKEKETDSWNAEVSPYFSGRTMPLVYEVDNIQSKLGRETCQVAGNFQRPQRGF